MSMPSIFRDDLLDDFFDSPSDRYGIGSFMNTDIRDTDNDYEVIIDMSGVRKEDVRAELRDGYPTTQVSTDSNKGERDSNGRYTHRERCSGSCSRSFYVGDVVTQGDIKVKFEDGALKLLIPKKEAVPEVEERKYIAIGG